MFLTFLFLQCGFLKGQCQRAYLSGGRDVGCIEKSISIFQEGVLIRTKREGFLMMTTRVYCASWLKRFE